MTNGLGGLGQSAVVNVLQGLSAQQIKELADGLGEETTTKDKDGRDVTTFTPTTESELLRGALQGIAGCAAGAAGGSGDCGSAALGAASSVAINLLIDSLKDQKDKATFDKQGNQTDADTAGDLQHSRDVTALVGLIAEALDLDPNAASTAGQIETENNQICVDSICRKAGSLVDPTPEEIDQNERNWDAYLSKGAGAIALEAADGNRDLVISCFESSQADGCAALQQKIETIKFSIIDEFAGDDIELANELKQQVEDRSLSTEELVQIRDINEQDSVLAHMLAEQSPEVRQLFYRDIREGRGDNIIGQLAASGLEAVLSEETIYEYYFARLSDEAGEVDGVFDEWVAAEQNKARSKAQERREKADIRAQEMRREGYSEAVIKAYIADEYWGAAADEAFSVGLLSQLRGLSDLALVSDAVGERTLKNTLNGVDAILKDETHLDDALAAGQKSIEDFTEAEIREQATAIGKGTGCPPSAPMAQIVVKI